MAVTINGTTGISTPGVTNAGNETIAGTLQVGGVTTNIYPLVSGTAQASTSGTSIDFTSIPSWVKRITVMFNGVSTNGSSLMQIQIGSGSVTTTGYVSGAHTTNNIDSSSTTGFVLVGQMNASATYNGSVCILLSTTNTYNSTGNLSPIGAVAAGHVSGGWIALGGALDRVRITTVNGTDAFDAGSINILYE